MKEIAPILVTGSHRSGSTWVGRTLAYDERLHYIHEPFNIDIKNSVLNMKFPYWYQFVNSTNEGDYCDRLDSVMSYQYPLLQNIRDSKNLRDVAANIRNQLRSMKAKSACKVPLVKDPLAFFSAEWLSSRYGMNVVMLSRHPAAFCSSIKLKGWTFDFNHFLNQPMLMEGYLEPFADEIAEMASQPKGIIDQGILLWNCVHSTLLKYREIYPDWMVVSHEDLSLDPVKSFEQMYAALGLSFTDGVHQKILNDTGGHNFHEQDAKNEFVRDSRKNVTNWKKRLESDEITKIRDNTEAIAIDLYDPIASW